MRCRSIAFAYVLLPVALAGAVSASGDERAAGAIAGHWYASDGSRKVCSTPQHFYQRLLCPCERAADAVIACVPGVAYQGLDCWPYNKSIEECLRRKAFGLEQRDSLDHTYRNASSLLPANNLATISEEIATTTDIFSKTSGLEQSDSLDHTYRNASSLPPAKNSATISQDTPADGAAIAVYVAIPVLGVGFLCIIACIAYLVIGKKTRLHRSEDLEAGEALQKGVVQELPG